MSGLNIRDAESSYLEARSQVEDWKAEFLGTWFRPEIDMMLVQFWAGLDPLVHAELKARNPEAHRNAERQVKEAEERLRNGI